jgi:hypothetical protein
MARSSRPGCAVARQYGPAWICIGTADPAPFAGRGDYRQLPIKFAATESLSIVDKRRR